MQQLPTCNLSLDIPPFSNLKKPVFYLQNIKFIRPPDWLRGWIYLKKEFESPLGKKKLLQYPRIFSILAQKAKPNLTNKLTYKMHEDIDAGTLIKIPDILKL